MRCPTVKRCTPSWRADDLARDVADGAARHVRALPLEERRVVAVGHEADLVAVGLFGDRQAELARVLADRRLVERADREHRVRELRLVQREEEVRLILRRIDAALQAVAAGLGRRSSTRA